MTSPSRLKWPLKEVLSTGDDPEAEARLARRIHARLAKSPQRRVPLRVVASLAAVTIVSLLWAARGLVEPSPAGVLLSRSGDAFHSLESAVDGRPSRVQFQDGSCIEVAPGGAVRGLGSNGQTMATLVERGKVRFDVAPGGPRRWVVEAGILSVEVLGTQFSVDRAGDRVTVEVYRGAVVVRSDLLKDGVRRLAAGERAQVAPPETSRERSSDPEDAPGDTSVSLEEVMQSKAPDDSKSRNPSVAAGNTPAERTRTKTADEWMRSADEARLVGDTHGAIRALETLLAEHPGDERASFARFQLARWYLDDGRSTQAESLFRQVAGGTGPLSEDAFLRLVQLKRSKGSPRDAAELARAYLERFPQGRHRRLMESLLLP